jgi:hypothetical protein
MSSVLSYPGPSEVGDRTVVRAGQLTGGTTKKLTSCLTGGTTKKLAELTPDPA